MPVKGLNEAMRGTQGFTREVIDIRAPRAITVALIIGQGAASVMTPVDTSFLINSQFRRVNQDGKNWRGMVGYTARYAAAVHEASGKLKGQPRRHFGKTKDGVEFGGGTGVGNYWDPAGEPGFLRKGFEENQAAIDAAFAQEMARK